MTELEKNVCLLGFTSADEKKKESKLLLPFDQKVPMKSILMTMVTVNETYFHIMTLSPKFPECSVANSGLSNNCQAEDTEICRKCYADCLFWETQRLIERLMAS